jgi:hypothetical protein
MAELPPPPLPPALADCITTFESPAGTVSPPSPSTLLRSLDGKMRVDLGATSVITNPVDAVVILLDHVKMEARLLPMSPGIPPVPGMPNLPGASPQAEPALPGNVEQLGQQLIQGIPSVGMRYTLPQLPGETLPPTVAEVWTCTATQLPVMSKITGAFGVRTSICKTAPIADPPQASFQIPAGYRQLP